MLASATGASRGGAWPASVDASLGPKVSALCSVGHMLAFAGGVAPRMPGQRAMSCRWPALRTAAGSTACWALAPRRSGRNAMGLCMAADGGRSGSRSSGSWGPGARGEGEMFGGADDNTWEDLKKVFVLLFNPRTEKEGICEHFPRVSFPIITAKEQPAWGQGRPPRMAMLRLASRSRARRVHPSR